MPRLTWAVAIALCSTAAMAGLAMADDVAGLKIGDKAPVWTDLPGADGKKHSLADLKDQKAVMVVFFENTCPDCELYTDRIKEVAAKFKDKSVSTVLLSVSKSPENDLAAMTKLSKEKSLPELYLLDKSQKIGRAFGAGVTPEVFLFDGDRKLVYRGAVDDHWKPAKVKRKHVEEAIGEVLAGKPVSLAKTEAEGCHIEYDE